MAAINGGGGRGGAACPPSPSTPGPSLPAAGPSTSTASASSSISRLWRPAAQRNLRNQWSKLFSCTQEWASASAAGRAHATSFVNSHLSNRYMPHMNLGVLSQMPGIRSKAADKLSRQQELHGRNMLSSYRNLVTVVSNMCNACSCMRCYVKGQSDSPLVQFCSQPNDVNDTGDGGGAKVFSLLSISSYEKWAYNLVQMFVLELSLKRLIVMEMLSISCKAVDREGCDEVLRQKGKLMWHEELYPGEFGELRDCDVLQKETIGEALPAVISNFQLDFRTIKLPDQIPNRETLQVYLTSWLVEVNISSERVNQIFEMIGDEMVVKFS